MIVLSLDTATPGASVAITTGDGDVLAEATARVTTHSELLLGLIDQVLRNASRTVRDLDAVVCGAGPGSFTGLRIGMATAKGICFAAGKPLCCVCSLDALGLAVAGLGPPGQAATAVVDARRGQLYWRHYQDGRPASEPTVGTVEAFLTAVETGNPLLVGEGALAFREQVERRLPEARWAPEQAHRIRAAELTRCAGEALAQGRFSSLEQAVPLYLRAPDIRRPGGGAQQVSG